MPYKTHAQTVVPFRRHHRRRFRRRRPGMVRSRTFWRPTVPPHTGQPTTMKVKMRYAFEEGKLLEVASTGGIVNYAYRANDCFDPNQSGETGGGHQPLCFDQWMALYKRGIVLGSRVVARFFLGTGSSTAKAMRCYIVRKSTTTAPTLIEATEGRASASKILTAEHDIISLTNVYSYKTWARDPFDQDELEFTSSGTPSKQTYFHVGGIALNLETQTCAMTGYIEYIVLLSDPINPSAS